jgi:hypothetical protein
MSSATDDPGRSMTRRHRAPVQTPSGVVRKWLGLALVGTLTALLCAPFLRNIAWFDDERQRLTSGLEYRCIASQSLN